MRNLRETVNQVSYLFTEVTTNRVEIYERVFNNVVQKAGGNGHFVELHVRENICDFERVYEVRLTRSALLSLVFFGRKEVSATEQIEVCLRVVVSDFLDDVFDPDH